MPKPDFIIIGGQKCGTTALARLLRRHPDIHMPGRYRPSNGEMHFFDQCYDHGLAWYFNRFDANKVSGEKTPNYLCRPDAMVRMARAVPKAKIIVLLRDPVLRFFSNFRHCRRLAKQHKHGYKPMSLREFHDGTRDQAHWRGCYYAQLQILFNLYPRDTQVKIILTEDMRADTAGVVADLHKWLGVKPMNNVNNKHREVERPVMDEDIAHELGKFYRPHNLALADLIHGPQILKWISK
jgi:hypothetical protein